MALNYFFGRHQLSLANAKTAATPEARSAHRQLALAYAERIRQIRARIDAGALPLARVSQAG